MNTHILLQVLYSFVIIADSNSLINNNKYKNIISVIIIVD